MGKQLKFRDRYPLAKSEFVLKKLELIIFCLHLDDEARGHGGRQPDNLLQTFNVPCKRVRIQGLCTGKLQPADRPQCNKVLKSLVREEMRKQQVETLLAKQQKLKERVPASDFL